MTTTDRLTETTKPRRDLAIYSSLVGIAALIVIVQGVFAGIFLRYDGKRDASSSWIDAHAWGAHVGTVIAIVAAVFAVWKLRSKPVLMVGAILFAVLFLVEAYIGGEIRDHGKDSWTAVHVPLAMVIMGLAVYLPMKARNS